MEKNGRILSLATVTNQRFGIRKLVAPIIRAILLQPLLMLLKIRP
jgi:hypothetical protein